VASAFILFVAKDEGKKKNPSKQNDGNWGALARWIRAMAEKEKRS